ncbi:MAG: tryptophanase [Chloroflexota bacterium]
MNIKLSNGRMLPLEMHKVRIVQKINLLPIAQRLDAIAAAGYNTFRLQSRDVFLDLLTDSGTNAMSDNQLAAMFAADDAYAGSESFCRLAAAVKDVLGFACVLPVHQGRAAEHLLAKTFVKPGMVVLTNYHFSTFKAHVELVGGQVVEVNDAEALNTQSADPFKGNADLQQLDAALERYGAERIAFLRMEATTNLIGGQPFALQNLRAVKEWATAHRIPLVYDGSLISENAYFIQQREEAYKQHSLREIILEMMSLVDIFYMSGRKSAAARGGLMATNDPAVYEQLLAWLPLYEGFATYGGISTREIEAMAVGLQEMTDPAVAGSAPEFIRYFAERLHENGVPVVTPPGGLACHVDARRFLPHVPPAQYPAAALTAAIYIAAGMRSMERGSLSNERDASGKEKSADLELARLAIPRRVYTLSHIEYAIDRLTWLYQQRDLVGGLAFTIEPPKMRFFFGQLRPIDDWGSRLAQACLTAFGPNG